METSDNNASESPAPRRSGRARVAPQKFSPEPRPSQSDHASSSKRKRGQDNDDDDDIENEEPDVSDEDAPTDDERDDDDDDDDDDNDDADADDEPARRPKKPRSSQKPRSKKPTAKRAKVNGTAPTAIPGLLGVPGVKLPNRPKKTTKVAPASLARRDNNDLYSEKRIQRQHIALLVVFFFADTS